MDLLQQLKSRNTGHFEIGDDNVIAPGREHGHALRGGGGTADAFIRGLNGIRLAPSLGDVATTVSYPASTSHRGLSPQQRAALGITDGLVRISVGIEHIDDLKAEFDSVLIATAAG